MLLDDLAFLYYLGDAKVANLDSFLAIQEDVVKFDVPVYDGPAVDVSKAISNLLENEFGIRFLKFTLSLDQPQQITTAGIFHDHEKMLTGLKHLQESDDIGVLDLLEQVHFLKDLSLAEVVLHIVLLYSLDGHLLARKFMDSQSYFAKCSFSDQFHKFVEVECCWWELIVFLDVLFNIFDELISFLQDGVVDSGSWPSAG